MNESAENQARESETIYMNNAASGWPRCPGVVEAIRDELERCPHHAGRSASAGEDAAGRCRLRLASFLGLHDSSRLVFTCNATHALNLAILGLNLPPNAHIVSSLAEHNSVLRPLHHLRQRRPDIRLSLVGLDSGGGLDCREFMARLSEGAALVALTHASNVTGRVFEVEEFFELAHRAGALTLLDASQTFGALPLQPESLGADLLVFTGHKALHGPPGSGGLYVSPSLELEQMFVGGTGVRSDLEFHPREMPMRLEAGTPDNPVLAGFENALGWHEVNGAAFNARSRELTGALLQGLGGTAGISLIGAGPQDRRIGIVSFVTERWSVEETGFILAESFGIICRSGLHCAPLIHGRLGCAPEGTVRLSLSGFNTQAEVERVITSVRRLVK